MSLFVASLNSGSNGNCYYIGDMESAVLIDCGLSCRETERRMKRLGLSMKKVKGIFITHEHADHIFGLQTISKRYRIPVYLSSKTRRSFNPRISEDLIHHFEEHQPIQCGEISIVPFPKLHDAADPYSVVVQNESVKVGVFTDIGSVSEHVINYFKQCHAVFLESNYDEEMLRNGTYPWVLKERIRSDAGHLSNEQALKLFRDHRPEFMTHLFLSHLSQHNNSPRLVKNLFETVADGVRIIIAPRYKETPLYHIRGGVKSRLATSQSQTESFQLQLF
jgi:phosphoribosyl 1,2-cyclic phosphodiesterase